jgi:hypothetical protein
MKDNRYCLICRPRNRTIYFHRDPETGDFWLWCNKCQRGYSLRDYCYKAGIELADFLKGDFDFEDGKSNEVQAMNFPSSYVPLSDPRAEKGTEYLKNRGLSLDADVYYDIDEEGIVLPYYFGSHFVGAQVRFIEPRINKDGEEWKITTIPGTRIGLLFGLWNQEKFITDVKGVVVCEGYFNALAIQQALNSIYGGVANNPWKCVSASGSGLSEHQAEVLKDLKEKGYKVVLASDTDEAGFKMIDKAKKLECITHFALTGDTEKDWNDELRELGNKQFAKFFLSSIKVAD